MMDKFRVGQKVRIIASASDHVGQVFSIVRGREIEWVTDLDFVVRALFVYRLDNKLGIKPHSAEEHELEPVYDGDQASNWSESAWKPNPVSVPSKDAQSDEKKIPA